MKISLYSNRLDNIYNQLQSKTFNQSQFQSLNSNLQNINNIYQSEDEMFEKLSKDYKFRKKHKKDGGPLSDIILGIISKKNLKRNQQAHEEVHGKKSKYAPVITLSGHRLKIEKLTNELRERYLSKEKKSTEQEEGLIYAKTERSKSLEKGDGEKVLFTEPNALSSLWNKGTKTSRSRGNSIHHQKMQSTDRFRQSNISTFYTTLDRRGGLKSKNSTQTKFYKQGTIDSKNAHQKSSFNTIDSSIKLKLSRKISRALSLKKEDIEKTPYFINKKESNNVGVIELKPVEKENNDFYKRTKSSSKIQNQLKIEKMETISSTKKDSPKRVELVRLKTSINLRKKPIKIPETAYEVPQSQIMLNDQFITKRKTMLKLEHFQSKPQPTESTQIEQSLTQNKTTLSKNELTINTINHTEESIIKKEDSFNRRRSSIGKKVQISPKNEGFRQDITNFLFKIKEEKSKNLNSNNFNKNENSESVKSIEEEEKSFSDSSQSSGKSSKKKQITSIINSPTSFKFSPQSPLKPPNKKFTFTTLKNTERRMSMAPPTFERRGSILEQVLLKNNFKEEKLELSPDKKALIDNEVKKRNLRQSPKQATHKKQLSSMKIADEIPELGIEELKRNRRKTKLFSTYKGRGPADYIKEMSAYSKDVAFKEPRPIPQSTVPNYRNGIALNNFLINDFLIGDATDIVGQSKKKMEMTSNMLEYLENKKKKKMDKSNEKFEVFKYGQKMRIQQDSDRSITDFSKYNEEDYGREIRLLDDRLQVFIF
jgi:hypothetical protein